ncbi:MAG: alternative ribosome rescue aminoacyl-tRNA hydrolase ArfB [Petrimonas sp.]|nr:alternative ribosome rescue aminoacyl-tRNA hydrolase ArfB [Petrimonas sp.]
MNLDMNKLIKECVFTAARSSGSGGQNVNKVSTKITLSLQIEESAVLSDEQKMMISERLKNKIGNDGRLQISNDTERTQFLNKKAVIKKLELMLQKALKERKKRIATKPTKLSKEKRLEDKKRQSDKKSLRGEKW